MKLQPGEHRAILTTLAFGRQHGYGNLMAHLAAAWADEMIRGGMPEDAAIEFVSNREPYSLAMHRDIIERGEWDETGEKYRSSAK